MSDVSIHPATSTRFVDRLREAFLDGDGAAAAKEVEAMNVAMLTEQYRAIARGDLPTVIAQMAEGIEFELRGPHDIPISGHWRGLAEVVAAMRSNFGALADQEAEVQSVVAQGDTVVILAQERGMVRATAARYHLRWVQVFTFRDGKVIQIRGVAAHLPHPEARAGSDGP